MTITRPETSTIDLFSDHTLQNTQEVFAQLRETAAVVHLPANDVWAVTRYEDIREALSDPATFSSKGVAFNPQMNEILSGTSLAADPPEHGPLRAVLTDNLSPRAMRSMKAEIYAKADALVQELAAKGSFDGMKDMAVAFPVSIVLDLIGVQGDLRAKILPWGEAAFNLLGPMNERSQQSMPIAGELFQWTHEEMQGTDLAEGSIGRNIWEAAERGDISHDSFGYIVHQILAAGMDTTITTIGNALVLLGQHPDQFELLKADPKLVPAAVTEVLRVRTPAPVFGRQATRDVEIDGTVIPAGAQVALLYGSGNMDPRKFDDPETFDIKRNPVDHLGFGYGIHACAGQGLAKLEIHGLVEAWAKYVDSFQIGEVVQRLNNMTRPYKSIEVTDVKLRESA
ncbi:MAG TPA: cytochrome P450 [Enteractinococcus sp.]